MKLMCVNTLSLEEGYIPPLTPGKIYESIERKKLNLYIWEDDTNYYITNDTGSKSWELIENFITLEEWREQQLKKLI